MSELKMNKLEQDLLALIKPFKSAEAVDGGLRSEAQALLNFVDSIITSGQGESIDSELWHDYLNTTGRPEFLTSLDTPVARSQWADLMFGIVDASQYTLLTMMQQRVREHPVRALFRELNNGPSLWSYEQVLPT